jgi:glycosyltransferase involved in cell wall biosynthesis/SAM-dependent methyltransferase
MRICSPHCGLAPETTSGGETYERELLLGLARLGVEIELLLARGKPVPGDVTGWRIHRLPIRRGLRWPVTMLLLPPFIGRVYRARPFDMLRVHSLRFIGPAALVARRRYRLDVPVVAHHHHLDAHWLNPVIEKRVIEASDHVVVGSEFSRRQLAADLGVRTEHVSVIPYGIDARFRRGPRAADLVARFGLDGRPVVLFLGGLKGRKNPFLLLDIWRRVLSGQPEARLLIAGGGGMLAAMRDGVRQLGLDGSVILTGYVPEARKVDYYNLADVFVFPSALEGFGLAVGEAMSCGLPVVASDRGSIPELVVDGEGGFLCDPARPDTFATRLSLLLADATLRDKLGRANEARVQQLFRWDRCARRTLEVYEHILDRWRAARPRPSSSAHPRRETGFAVAAANKAGGAVPAPVTSSAWLLRSIDLVNRKGKSVGVRLVRLTGKRPFAIHPKHLVDTPWHDWYVPYLKPSDLVLDVGCANGAHSLRAARACARVLGCDYDIRQLRVAADTARATGITTARFFAWDVTGGLPFADRSFDAVLFLDVIEHLDAPGAALREIARVLKDTGRLLVSGPNRDTRWRRRLRAAGLFAFSDPDHRIEYTEAEFLAELADGGFVPEGAVMPVVYDTPWAGIIDAIGGLSLTAYARLARWKRAAALRHPEESTGFQVVARKAEGMKPRGNPGSPTPLP